MCFSCGKAGHSATRCPTLDDSFPLMSHCGPPSHRRNTLWKAEKTPGGYIMISPWAADPGGGGGSPPGSVVMFDPRTRGGVQHGSPFPGKELLHGLEIHPCRPTCDHSRCLHGFRQCWSRRPGFGVLGDWHLYL